MKKIIFIVTAFVCVAFFVILAKGFRFSNTRTPSLYLSTNQSSDSIPDGMKKYGQTVRNQSEGWRLIREGNTYFLSSQYEKAAECYKKAYEIDSRNGLFSGTKLIDSYEKLSKYDDALAVLDDILKNQPLADMGISRFQAMRTRLLAAKQAADQ